MEYKADLGIPDANMMFPHDNLVEQDNVDLLSCVFKTARKIKKNPGQEGNFQMIHFAAISNSLKTLKFLLDAEENPN